MNEDLRPQHWWPGPDRWIFKYEHADESGITWILEWGWTKRGAMRKLQRALGAYIINPPSWDPDDCADLLERP